MQIGKVVEKRFANGEKRIFIGHFHSAREYKINFAHMVYLLPAWFETGLVTVCDSGNKHAPVEFINWETLSL
jgi:hypothetical protein